MVPCESVTQGLFYLQQEPHISSGIAAGETGLLLGFKGKVEIPLGTRHGNLP